MELTLRRGLTAFLAAAALAAASLTAAAIPARAATLDVCADGCTYSSISAAYSAAASGDTITVAAGSYGAIGTLNGTKNVTIEGAGNGTDPATNTVISGSGSGTGVTLTPQGGTSITLKNVRITGFTTGIVVGSNVTLDNVVSTANANYGVNLNVNNASGLRIYDSEFSYNASAVKIPSNITYTDIYIENSHFDNNTSHGWYAGDGSSATAPVLDDVTIVDSTFNNNGIKGFYTERGSNVLLQRVQSNNSGNERETLGAGIEFNLKWRTDFENISLIDVSVHNSGRPPAEGVQGTVDGSGIAISARSDGANYGAKPAALAGVLLDGVTVSGATNGIYFGFNLTESPVVRNSFVYGNEYAIWNDTAGDWSPGVMVDAVRNFWGSPTPDFSSLFRGHSVSASPWYTDGTLSLLATSPTADDPVVALPGGDDVVIVIPEGIDEPLIDVSSLQEGDGSFTLEGDVEIVAPSGASLQLAEGTTITPDDEDWDGLFIPPTVVEIDTVTPPGQPESDVILAIKVGSDDVSFEVDPAARLLLPGAAKKNAKVGFIAPGGTFTAITTQCTADTQDAGNAAARDCYIVVGDDIVVWTKHFTTFLAYTQVLAESGTEPSPLIPVVTGVLVLGLGLYIIGRRREAEALRW